MSHSSSIHRLLSAIPASRVHRLPFTFALWTLRWNVRSAIAQAWLYFPLFENLLRPAAYANVTRRTHELGYPVILLYAWVSIFHKVGVWVAALRAFSVFRHERRGKR